MPQTLACAVMQSPVTVCCLSVRPLEPEAMALTVSPVKTHTQKEREITWLAWSRSLQLKWQPYYFLCLVHWKVEAYPFCCCKYCFTYLCIMNIIIRTYTNLHTPMYTHVHWYMQIPHTCRCTHNTHPTHPPTQIPPTCKCTHSTPHTHTQHPPFPPPTHTSTYSSQCNGQCTIYNVLIPY